jgi:hypothetical protein
MTMPKITSSMLRAKNACGMELATFESEWPDGLEVTEAVADRVVELGLSVGWAVENFLKASARAEYERVKVRTAIRLYIEHEKQNGI